MRSLFALGHPDPSHQQNNCKVFRSSDDVSTTHQLNLGVGVVSKLTYIISESLTVGAACLASTSHFDMI